MRRTARQVVIDFAELSDPGLDPQKQVNEDSAGYAETALGHLAVVCDGMGGHVGGRAASEAAVHAVLANVAANAADASAPSALTAAIQAAGVAVHALGGLEPGHTRPGATCVALLVNERGALVAHVGDSRALLVHDDALHRLTRDHSLVEELVAAGVLAPDQTAHHPEANKITRALGILPTVEVELRPTWVPLRPGDLLLLVTDGVTDLVTDEDLLALVRARLNLGTAVLCQAVIELANARGGHDNATVQALHVLEAPPAPSAGDTRLLDAPPPPPAPALRTQGLEVDPTRPGPVPGPLPGPSPQRRRGAPAPTIVDEWPSGAHPTEPDLSSRRGPRWRAPSVVRPLLALALSLLLAVVAALWLRHRRAADDGVAPADLIVESSAPAPSLPTPLVPDVEEEERPDPPRRRRPHGPRPSFGAGDLEDSPPLTPTGTVAPVEGE